MKLFQLIRAAASIFRPRRADPVKAQEPVLSIVGYGFNAWQAEDGTVCGYSSYHFFRDQDGKRHVRSEGISPDQTNYWVEQILPWLDGLKGDDEIWMHCRAGDAPRAAEAAQPAAAGKPAFSVIEGGLSSDHERSNVISLADRRR